MVALLVSIAKSMQVLVSHAVVHRQQHGKLDGQLALSTACLKVYIVGNTAVHCKECVGNVWGLTLVEQCSCQHVCKPVTDMQQQVLEYSVSRFKMCMEIEHTTL